MKRFSSAVTPIIAALLVAPAALGAQSQDLSINGTPIAKPKPTIIRTDAPILPSGAVDPSLANGYDFVTGTGVNLNGVANFIIPDPFDDAFIFTCSASRIGARAIITAAHCVTDDATGALFSTSGASFARFLQPGSTNAAPSYLTVAATSVVVNPFWHGFNNPTTYLGTDMAIVTFGDDLPSWITTYGLYTTPPLGLESTHAGYGTFGGPTGPTDFDFGRRWGTNVVDYIETDFHFADYLDLYTDFDDPDGDFDTFCLIGIACSDHVFTEATTAEGDSGGPLFIDGLLAGITSFGTYICEDPDAADCVPFGADHSRPFDTYGSLAGYAPVYANMEFIAPYTAPEPGTIALVATGLGVIGMVSRRRRTADKV